MAERTQTYIKMPWSGGINDSVNPGVLPDDDLVIAQNVVMGTAGSRLKREGLNYFDQLATPAASSVAKSGTTITITFATDITSATNQIFFVGERIAVVTADSEYNNLTATVTALPTNDSIQYTVGVEPTAASTTLTSITRLASIVGIHDFWYFDSASNSKLRSILAVNSDAQTFRYSDAGLRVVLTNKTYTMTFTDAGDIVTFNSHGLVAGDFISFTSITSTTGISVNTTYYVGGTITSNTFQLTTIRGGTTPVTLTTDGSGTAVSPLFTTSIEFATFATMNERCLIAYDGIGNVPKIYEPQTSTTTIRGVFGASPNANYLQVHQGRVWCDDKKDMERLFYSSPFNIEEWNGYGDSGKLDIGFGDGDPDGLNTIYPPFKNTLFVAKRNKLYRIDGDSPDFYTITPVSVGIGSVGHMSAAAIDMDDVAYVSYKGIHSLAATNAHGGFQSSFLSDKIQNAFKELQQQQLDKCFSIYIPNDNALYFSLPTGSISTTTPDALYLFNTKFKSWSAWPDILVNSLGMADILNKKELLIGTSAGRILKVDHNVFSDYESTAYTYRVQTGAIHVDGNPNSMKAFKRLGFILKPTGSYTFSVRVTIDNHQSQSLSFTQTTGSARLGVNFILGASVLAGDYVLGPYTLPIDGIGHGITITIEQTAADQQVEIYGLVIEYESADSAQETNEGGDE